MYYLLYDMGDLYKCYAIVDSAACTWSGWRTTLDAAITTSCTRTVSGSAIRKALATYAILAAEPTLITISTHPELLI